MIKLKFLCLIVFSIRAELTENAYQRYLVDRMDDNQEKRVQKRL